MKVIAIGTAVKKITDEERAQIMPHEAPHTLEMLTHGYIETPYFRADKPGTVFIMNVDSVEHAKKLTDDMEFVKRGVIQYELIPVGPMKPLGFLIKDFPKHFSDK